MPGGPSLLSIQEQCNWASRISKEKDVNRVQRGNFAVRSAISDEDVPQHFKPLHLTPQDAARPAQPLLSTNDISVEAEIREVISARRQTRREQQPWPETSQQVVGWLQAPVGVLGSPRRAGLTSGISPRQGIGWANGREAAERRQRLGLQVAGDAVAGTASSAAGPPLAAVVTDEQRRHQPLVDAAENSRQYLNNQGPNKWYRPKGTCDVVDFGDRYTRAYGTNIFAQKPAQDAK